MEFKLVKSGIWFKPAFDQDYEISKKIGQGHIISGKIEKQRNYKLHQKAFVCLNIGFENQEQETNFEAYRAKILIGVGHCYVIILESGEANFIPKSMSYDEIPDDYEFGVLYNKIVEKVAQKINVTDQALAEQIASHF